MCTEVALLTYHINDPINARKIRSREMFLLKSIILHFNWKIKAAFIQREHCWHSIIFHSLLILQKQPNQSLSSPHYTKLSFYHTNQVMSSLFTTLHLGKSPNIECSQKSPMWSGPCLLLDLTLYTSLNFTTVMLVLASVLFTCHFYLLECSLPSYGWLFHAIQSHWEVSFSEESFPDYPI